MNAAQRRGTPPGAGQGHEVPEQSAQQNDNQGLARQIGRGLAWSSVNNIILRLGSFAVGIVLARLLAPEQFGVFAIALTVQAVLMSLADLGMSTDLIRSSDAARKAPTVATVALIASAGLTAVMVLSSDGLARLLGSPDSAPVIAVMAFSLVLAGAGVVPYAALQRSFAQRKLFAIAGVDFAVGTTLTIILISLGWGVMALAIGRLVAQGVALVLQFLLARQPIRFGFDRALAPAIFAYGLPVAGANLLSWALLNVDNVAISRLSGPIALGFYFLAFNVSNWPMSALGQIVRSVSIPAFSRLASGRRDETFARVLGPVWALTLLAGLMLATLAGPVIEVVYGSAWAPAAGILVWLGLFGAIRTVFDLAASYLLARGHSTETLLVQVCWIVVLVPAVVAGMLLAGPAGVAAAHLVTAVVVVVPAYAVALRRAGADLRGAIRSLWPPLLAAVPAVAVSVGSVLLLPNALGGLLVGGLTGVLTYSLLIGRWVLRRVRSVALAGGDPAEYRPTDAGRSIIGGGAVDNPLEIATSGGLT